MRFQVSKLPIKFGSSQVVQLKATGTHTRQEIQNIANERSRELYSKGLRGKIQVSLKYDESEMGYAWRSAGFRPIGQNPVLHSPSEYDSTDYGIQDQAHFREFRIYFVKSNPAGGCSSALNDCLFNCLQTAITPNLFYFKNPESLKKYFRLKRTDRIDIKNIPDLEKFLSHKINVQGDFIHSSVEKYNKTINLTLIDGHYDLINPERKQKGIALDEKKIVMYKKLEKNLVLTYDGENFIEATSETIREIRQKPRSSHFILVPFDSHPDDEDSIVKEYGEYIKTARIWKEITHGNINFWKTGTFKKTAVDYFYKISNVIETEQILQDEAIWIDEATSGALIFADKYEGPVHSYDFCSMYPSLLKKNTRYPTRRGEFKKITQTDFEAMTFFPMGIYHCEIELDSKLFRKNRNNKYTNIDITEAKKRDAKMTIICDDDPNFLYYSTEKTAYGKQIFGDYIDYLFNFKKKGIPGSKLLLNILWGELCSTDIKPYYITEDQPEVIVQNRFIHSLELISDNTIKIETTYHNKLFNTDFARIKPFILAHGRALIGKVMEPHMDDIKRCHTDGFFITKKIADIPKGVKFGNDIGELKYEGHFEKIKITNPNSYVIFNK